MRWIALTALCVVGCLGTRTTVCDNGAICPVGLACTGQMPIACGEPANVVACAGKSDHVACSSSVESMGTCSSGVCSPCSPELVECRYDGWIAMQSATDQELFGVFALAANDVYAIGAAGTVVHYDGRTWTSTGPVG